MLEIPPGTGAPAIADLLVSRGVLGPSVAFSRPLLDRTHSPPAEGG